MNGFFGQSIQARTELDLIANVKNQIVGAKDSNPIIGCVQDGVTGAYLLTLDDVSVDSEEALYLMSRSENPKFEKIKKNKKYSGKEIFSTIIPEGINSMKKNFEVKNGELLKGSLNKSTIASKKNSLIHYVYDKKGGLETRRFVDDTQRMVLNYLILRGFTVGFGDCFIDKDTFKKVKKQINDKLLDNYFEISNMENQGSTINPETYEDTLQASLNSLGANTYKVIQDNLEKTNNFHVMTFGAQAKGKGLNIGQIMSCIGAVSVEGKRVKKKVNGRTLAHFPYNEDSALSRGFVASNFLEGMKGYEYFFHSMGGREGLIDTALKTSSTGYIQRKLVKALEDLRVTYDGTVRNSNGTIVEFLYGDNGIDQLMQSENKLSTIVLSNKDIEEHYGMSKSELKSSKSKESMNSKYVKDLIELRKEIREKQMDSMQNYGTIESSFLLPVNLYRIMSDYTDSKRKSKNDLKYEYVLEKIEEILTDNKTDLYSKRSKFQDKDESHSKKLFRLGLMEYLSPKKCVFDYNLNKKDFDEIVEDIKSAFLKAVVQPGEMVGVITAQSLGEPTTQMNLNTKHFAGAASKSSANMGVPRIEEILSNSKNIKTPMTSLFLKEINDGKLGKYVNNHLNTIKINDLISDAEIYYHLFDDKDNELNKKLKSDGVDNPFYLNDKKDSSLFPWVFRIELDRETMLDKDIVLLDVKTKIVLFYYDIVQDMKSMKKEKKELWENIMGGVVLSNKDTSDTPTIHIRLGLNNFDYPMIIKLLKSFMNDVYLKGVKGITGSDHSKEIRILFDEKTGAMESKPDYENVITAAGINLNEFRVLKGVNQERMYFNDVNFVYKTFGIEAARSILVTELKRTFNAGGAGFNYNHLVVLTNLMTYTGDIVSIDRNGTSKMELDPLARASFEKMMEHFVNAAVFNQKDRIKATSSRIMTGRVIPGGTGSFELMMDTEKLANSEFLDDEYQGRTQFEGFRDNALFEDIMGDGEVNVDFLT